MGWVKMLAVIDAENFKGHNKINLLVCLWETRLGIYLQCLFSGETSTLERADRRIDVHGVTGLPNTFFRLSQSTVGNGKTHHRKQQLLAAWLVWDHGLGLTQQGACAPNLGPFRLDRVGYQNYPSQQVRRFSIVSTLEHWVKHQL